MSRVKSGRIIRAISGFYYVYTQDDELYECHAKGINRYKKEKPLVGDMVEIEVLDEKEKEGSIVKLCERTSTLIRPAVANADAAMIVTSLNDPKANTNLLDRFLIQMEWQNMPCIVCFNKADIGDEKEIELLMSTYAKVPYKTIAISAKTGEGLDKLHEILEGKITVVAGQSGAGKSTLVNALQTDVVMETGEISKKLGRGRHTTRRAELIPVNPNTFIVDTPGFSSIDMQDIEEQELQDYFPEIKERYLDCFYTGCAHINEPKCAVKDALAEGNISQSRYDSYISLYDLCKNRRKY